jgi:hypothetical protein
MDRACADPAGHTRGVTHPQVRPGRTTRSEVRVRRRAGGDGRLPRHRAAPHGPGSRGAEDDDDFRRVYVAVLADWLALPAEGLGGSFTPAGLFAK